MISAVCVAGSCVWHVPGCVCAVGLYSVALEPMMQVEKDCLPGGRQLISNVLAPYKCLVHIPWCVGDDARHCGVQRKTVGRE